MILFKVDWLPGTGFPMDRRFDSDYSGLPPTSTKKGVKGMNRKH